MTMNRRAIGLVRFSVLLSAAIARAGETQGWLAFRSSNWQHRNDQLFALCADVAKGR